MNVISRTSEEIIKTAEECFSLGLIDEKRLQYVTQRALTQPGYSPVSDLPFSWEIAHERNLRRKEALLHKKGTPRRWLKRMLLRG